MLAFFIFSATAALVSIQRPEWITTIWILPLGIFSVSVLAAVACRPRLRRDPALLGLHLALLVLIVLVGVARLTYLDGAVTLTEGAAFDGSLSVVQRGPLHTGRVESIRFANEGVIEDFADRDRWRATYNRVRWWDERGASGVATIGDDSPLLLGGYRIYTTFNRGYSPVFLWESSRNGSRELGTVQLKADEEFGMSNAWQLPDGPDVWVMLDPQQDIRIERGTRRSNMGADNLAHSLVLRIGERREVLALGASLTLPEGRLTYVELKTWMGYRITHDFAAHWLASAAAIIVLCLVAFYARLLRQPEPAFDSPQLKEHCA